MLPVSGMEHPHTRMPEIKLLMNTPNANFGQVKEIGKTLIFKVKTTIQTRDQSGTD